MLPRSRNHDSGKGTPGAELGVAKQDMRPEVQSHLDNLEAQVTRILEQYGVSSFEELKALGEEDTDNVELEDITRLLELAHAISNIVETGEITHEAGNELAPFSYDKEKAREYGFSEVTIEAHPKAQELSDAIFERDPRFVVVGSAGEITLNKQAIKDFWQTNCQDLPSVPEKSMWYFKALAEHRLSHTIDSDDPDNLNNPTSPFKGKYDQESFMLTMDFEEFDFEDIAGKQAAITPQTKKILKTFFNTEDPTSITRDEINAALWQDHENRTHTPKALKVIKELLGSNKDNADDFELRLMRPDEYQRSVQDQGYGQKDIYTHMDGYYVHDDGHRDGLLTGFRRDGGAAGVDCDHRSDLCSFFIAPSLITRMLDGKITLFTRFFSWFFRWPISLR